MFIPVSVFLKIIIKIPGQLFGSRPRVGDLRLQMGRVIRRSPGAARCSPRNDVRRRRIDRTRFGHQKPTRLPNVCGTDRQFVWVPTVTKGRPSAGTLDLRLRNVHRGPERSFQRDFRKIATTPERNRPWSTRRRVLGVPRHARWTNPQNGFERLHWPGGVRVTEPTKIRPTRDASWTKRGSLFETK